MRVRQIQNQDLMNGTIALFVLGFIAGCGVHAKSWVDPSAPYYQPNNGNICLLAGTPPPDVRYEVLGLIRATKGKYGTVNSLLPSMASEARLLGANALINLQTGQKFKGPFPWRITAPTGGGEAIRVMPESPKIECVLVGGRLWGPGGREVFGAPQEIVPESVDDDIIIGQDTATKPGLHSELLKLDDLRKRGLLTDAEFEMEKKKLLDGN